MYACLCVCVCVCARVCIRDGVFLPRSCSLPLISVSLLLFDWRSSLEGKLEGETETKSSVMSSHWLTLIHQFLYNRTASASLGQRGALLPVSLRSTLTLLPSLHRPRPPFPGNMAQAGAMCWLHQHCVICHVCLRACQGEGSPSAPPRC